MYSHKQPVPGAASERSTTTVSTLILSRALRNLIMISPSTRCSSSLAMIWAKVAMITSVPARSAVKRIDAYSWTLSGLKVEMTWSKRYGNIATRMRRTTLRNVTSRVSIGRTDMSLV